MRCLAQRRAGAVREIRPRTGLTLTELVTGTERVKRAGPVMQQVALVGHIVGHVATDARCNMALLAPMMPATRQPSAPIQHLTDLITVSGFSQNAQVRTVVDGSA
ncbi:MAG: hypothetical protein OHK0048_00500 [Rhodoferax sp.]